MLIDFVPPWAMFFISIALVILAVEVGYRIGMTVYKKDVNERESPVSAIAGTILGLQAFMLAFTFGIVSDRYDTKKGLVREEANLIRTVWQRSDFLPEPDRSTAKAVLHEYIDKRIVVVQSHDIQLARSQVKEGRRLQRQMWNLALKHGLTDLNSDIGALFVESINDLATIQANRFVLGIEARIPTAIWFVLIALMILGMMAVGYHTAIAESRRSRITSVLAISFSLVIALIAVLDHPLNSILSVSQVPMIDVQNELREMSDDQISPSTQVR